MKKTLTRCFVKAEDIALLRRIKLRQAQNYLKKMRLRFSKATEQVVTLSECAEYFDIPLEVVEEAVLYNDLPDEEE